MKGNGNAERKPEARSAGPPQPAPVHAAARRGHRRGALVGSAFAGYALTHSQRSEAAEAVADRLGKLPRRRLGTRMGDMQVSPSWSCQDNSPETLGPCLEAGMNFIHKAGYWNSMPEEFKNIPRGSYYTDITVDSTPNNPDDEERRLPAGHPLAGSNGLQGYYDILRCHYGWKCVDEMKQKRGTHRAFERLKKEGKVRYFGVSQHLRALSGDHPGGDRRRADRQHAGLPRTAHRRDVVFEKAHKAGIGITAMKTVAHGGQPHARRRGAEGGAEGAGDGRTRLPPSRDEQGRQ